MVDQYKDDIASLLTEEYLHKIGCLSPESYFDHISVVLRHLNDWGVVTDGDVGETWEGVVAFHGFENRDIPSRFNRGDFKANHIILRRILKLHESMMQKEGHDPDFKPLQVELEKAPPVIFLILLADCITILLQEPGSKREGWRLEKIARIYLESYESKALEYGILVDAKRAADAAFSYINSATYIKLQMRMQELKPSGIALCQELTAKLSGHGELTGTQSSKFLFRMRSISSVARGLRVLFDDVPELIKISRLCDVGRIQILCDNREHLFLILGFLLQQFPVEETRLKDYCLYPKTSGYKAIHISLPVWVRHGDLKSRVLAEANETGAELEQIRFNLLLQEGTQILNGTIKAIRLYSEKYEVGNSIKVKAPDKREITLPVGSSVADFAFSVHSELGVACNGAILNEGTAHEKEVTREFPLRSGDVVRIVKSQSAEFKGPDTSWLDFCLTPLAREKIRQFIRSRNELKRFNHIVNINLIAQDDKGLTSSVADLLSRRNLYSSNFRGRVLRDGRAQFLIELLLTKEEKVYNIDKRHLIKAYKRMPHFLSISYHVSDISDYGIELRPLDESGNFDNTLRDAAYFSGRRSEITTLTNWYESSDSFIAVCGFYRAGKTLLVSQFINEQQDLLKINIPFNLCSHITSQADLFEWIIDMLEGQCQAKLKWAPEKIYGRGKLKTFSNYILEIIQYADANNKRLIFVFDDIDVVETLRYETPPPEPILARISKELKNFSDTYHATNNIKIILIGQYLLYRLVHKSNHPGLIQLLPLQIKRYLSHDDCSAYVGKRFQHFSKGHLGYQYLCNEANIEAVINKIGYNANNLKIAVNLIFEKLKMDAISGENTLASSYKDNNTMFTDYILKWVHIRMLNTNHSEKYFEQLKSHYLDERVNSHIYHLLKHISWLVDGKSETLFDREDLLSHFGNLAQFGDALDELQYFGFVHGAGYGKLEVRKNVTWDYIGLHFRGDKQ